MSNLFAIDPGLSGTGWAFLEGDDPVQAGSISVSSSKHPYPSSIGVYCSRIREVMRIFDIDEYAIEEPNYMGSAGGALAASSGSLVKLAALYGAYNALLTGERVTPVPVAKWKGNLPKKLVATRLREFLGKERLRGLGLLGGSAPSHTWDAIGIGLYVRGKF